MRGQQSRIDVVSNNLANVNTAGFKGDRAEFSDLLYQQLRTAGGTSATGTGFPTPLQVGMGVKFVATAKDFKQGNYIQTDQPLDIAIQGEGFFQIQKGDQVAYTRDGTFKRDKDGTIVTNNGYQLLPNMVIPDDATAITISQSGEVTIESNGDSGSTSSAGTIELVRFANPQGLTALGDNLYSESDNSGAPQSGTPGEQGFGTLLQGAYEGSNVSVVDELVQLIVSQRAFEASSKSVQTSDDMLQVAVNLKR